MICWLFHGGSNVLKDRVIGRGMKSKIIAGIFSSVVPCIKE